MNQMTEAFQKAAQTAAQAAVQSPSKVVVPMKERLWNFVKQHPRQTVSSLRSKFNAYSESNIGFHLRDMVDRGMLEAKLSGLTRQWGNRLVQDSTLYYFPIGHEYILRERKTPSKYKKHYDKMKNKANASLQNSVSEVVKSAPQGKTCCGKAGARYQATDFRY